MGVRVAVVVKESSANERNTCCRAWDDRWEVRSAVVLPVSAADKDSCQLLGVQSQEAPRTLTRVLACRLCSLSRLFHFQLTTAMDLLFLQRPYYTGNAVAVEREDPLQWWP